MAQDFIRLYTPRATLTYVLCRLPLRKLIVTLVRCDGGRNSRGNTDRCAARNLKRKGVRVACPAALRSLVNRDVDLPRPIDPSVLPRHFAARRAGEQMHRRVEIIDPSGTQRERAHFKRALLASAKPSTASMAAQAAP